MALSPSLPPSAPDRRSRESLERARARYRYRTPEHNQLHPISTAESWPRWSEGYSPSWYLRMGPGYLAAQVSRYAKMLRFGFQAATFRFDKMRGYEQVLSGPLPPFAREPERDDAFATWRIAGPNPLVLAQERDFAALCRKIPLARERIEPRLAARLKRPVSLEKEAEAGRLFAADFRLIQQSLRPARDPCRADPTRDSRWRAKYLPAPIGVFLEAPGFHARSALVPLAIQIDQPQPEPEHNPVYYPDDGWAWRIAKAYLEVADVSFNAGCGHVFRTHLLMEPFAMATPRQLSREHPVYVLLRPHLRFTLRVNREAYKYFIDRSKTYFDFYAGTLEETRQIAIQSCLERGFLELELEAELASRGVQEAPADYPYRDDARLWRQPIRDFVTAYVEAFYRSDPAVRDDPELQAWAAELMDPARGAVKKLVPGDRLDAKAKLVALLAQVLFTAGPGHASQHFSSNHYYRYAPAFPGAAHAPPSWQGDRAHEARFRNLLPPIRTAARQWSYNTFTNYRHDRFGHYDRYPLGRLPQAAEPIRRLHAALEAVEREILERGRKRPYPYEFLLPSRVPNSINI